MKDNVLEIPAFLRTESRYPKRKRKQWLRTYYLEFSSDGGIWVDSWTTVLGKNKEDAGHQASMYFKRYGYLYTETQWCERHKFFKLIHCNHDGIPTEQSPR